jgi:hypothetical protein
MNATARTRLSPAARKKQLLDTASDDRRTGLAAFYDGGSGAYCRGYQAAAFVVQSTAKRFKLTKSQAELVASMSSGASIAAAQYAGRVRVNREKTIDNVLAYVLGGISAIVKKTK